MVDTIAFLSFVKSNNNVISLPQKETFNHTTVAKINNAVYLHKSQ